MRDVGIVENLDKSLVFVLNGAMPRARITAEAAIALSQHGTVAPVTIHNRTRVRLQHDRRQNGYGAPRKSPLDR